MDHHALLAELCIETPDYGRRAV